MPKLMQCIECGKPIGFSARKCSNCQSDYPRGRRCAICGVMSKESELSWGPARPIFTYDTGELWSIGPKSRIHAACAAAVQATVRAGETLAADKTHQCHYCNYPVSEIQAIHWVSHEVLATREFSLITGEVDRYAHQLCDAAAKKLEQEEAEHAALILLRREAGVCTECGKPLGLLDKWKQRMCHEACQRPYRS